MKKIIFLIALSLSSLTFASESPGGDGVGYGNDSVRVEFDFYESERNKEFDRFTMENHDKVLEYLGPVYAGAWTEYGEDGNIYRVIAVTRQVKANSSIFPGDYYKFVYVNYSREELDGLKNKLVEIFMSPGGVNFGLINMVSVDVKDNKVEIVVFPQNKSQVLEILSNLNFNLEMIKLETSEFSHEPASNYHSGTKIFAKRDSIAGGWMCTGGFVGNLGIYHLLLTSGHCFPPGANKVYFHNGRGVAGEFIGDLLGLTFGGLYGMDFAVFSNANFAHNIRPEIRISPSQTIPVKGPVGVSDLLIDQEACSYGGVSGWRCGTIYKTDAVIMVRGVTLRNFIMANFCSSPGDSGGPVVLKNGGYALGILSTYHPCGAAFGGGGSSLRGSSFQPIMPVIRELKGFNLWTN